MSNSPIRHPQPYPSFEDPPPRAINADALLGRVVRRVVEDAAGGEERFVGTLRAVLVVLDQRAASGATRQAGTGAAARETPSP